ncbi:5-(carboxyamino)imidazole ribonucleotide mutase [Kaarinaea lacus]
MHTLVGVIMSSRSDWQAMKPATDTLARLRVGHEVRIMSANRKPETLYEYAESARERGLKMLIISAGSAVQLPSMLADKTSLPVVGVPVRSGECDSVDSFLFIANMPVDIPTDAFATGQSGPVQAALLAAKTLSSTNRKIREALIEYTKCSIDGEAKPHTRYAL